MKLDFFVQVIQLVSNKMEDTADFYISKLVELGIQDVSAPIFNHLVSIDADKLSDLLRELEELINSKTDLKGSEKKVWQGKKSRDIGLKFEAIIKFVFSGNSVFDVKTNIRSTTSEIDLILTLKTAAMYVPFLRAHHTIYGESKCHQKSLKKEWVDEMRTTLRDHGSSLGLLFLFCSSRAVAREARVSIGLSVAEERVVVPFGKKQFEELSAGANLLKLLQDQHRDAITHSSRLEI